MSDWAIAGVFLTFIVFGITEFMKEFGVNGKTSRAVVFVVSLVFIGLAYADSENLIPAEYWIWVKLVVIALAGALSAMGYYDFQRRRS